MNMPKRKNKTQILKEMLVGSAASRKPTESREIPGVKRQSSKVPVASKRKRLPCALKPSVLRRICHFPPEKCLANTEAMVMYVNPNFVNCDSQIVSHEADCPKVTSSPKSKPKMRQSPAAKQRSLTKKRT
ncbi:uncharacterized protein LOC108144280 [Drosophila elegans]|uniref:uncharacterized protein LOC108144280 n=1 Tax=Drosophila elegans TaxID=30023 RepID=UPI0007E5C7A4|nr:uncharacterized protein LOC108144280 [Drosophila elegans]